MDAISHKLKGEASYYQRRHIPPVSCLVNTFDFSEPKDFGHLISLRNGEGRPTMRYMPFTRFFESIAANATGLDTLMGERPDCWLYIHGPTHHWTSTARREAAHLLPAAEIFSTAACIWHTCKRMDVDVELMDFNGRHWREFRLALPLAMEKPNLAYEVPMGVVEIGKDEIPTTGGFSYEKAANKQPVIYFEPCREMHPREVQNFITASESGSALTLTTDVAVFDWQFPGAAPDAKPILQPVLLATRRSCNPEGNWYPQAGSHAFHFSITSHPGAWREGWKPGIQANHPFEIILGNIPTPEASLPEALSFFSASNDHILISTVKKAEDENAAVIRCYDIEGRDANVVLRVFHPIQRAEITNMIEQEGAPLAVEADGSVTVNMGHHAIETIRLHF